MFTRHPFWSNVFMSPQPDRTYDLKIGQPTVSYFLKQAAGIAKGAGKTGEMLCRSDVSALAPVFTQRAHPVKDTRLSAGSVWAPPWLMLYSWRGGTAAVGSGLFRKRELWISTFGALSNLQPHFSRWFLTPPPHQASPGHIHALLCPHRSLSFMCKGHETAGMVSVRAVYEIAQVKAQDECFKMRNTPLETVVKSIIGQARSLGIKVVNK